MNATRSLTTLALLFADTILQAEEKPALWILSGQSNACGRAALPGPKANPLATHYDPTLKKFLVAQDPLPGMGTTGVGPWVAAAQEVANGGVPVKTVGYASGGKPIKHWHPGQPGDKGLFPRIAEVGQKAGVFLWYQGESNTRPRESVAIYKTELKKLVARVRKQAANPDMTVLVVQLGAFTRKEERDFMGLRETQRQFVIEDGNALLVPALGRPLKDTVHLNNPGYQELGREIGRALLRNKYNKNVNWPGPVLDRAVVSEDGMTVTAHFAEVNQLNGCMAEDFAVLTRKGINKCVSAKTGKSVVTLKMTRPIAGFAKLIYAHGENPKATLVDEAGNHAPAVQINITTGANPKDTPTKAPNGAGVQ